MKFLNCFFLQIFYILFLILFSVATLHPNCGMIYLDLTVLGWVLMIWLELVRSTFMKRKVCTRHIFHFYTSVHLSCRPSIRPFHMSRSNLRTPWPIHFKYHRVIGIDGLTVCILYGEISIFIAELWDFIHQIVGHFSYVTL